MKKRDLILKTAGTLFAARGFKNTNMAELARLTGVAEGTVFYHFKTKEDLFLEILRVFRSSVSEAFTGYEETEPFTSGLNRVEKLISFYLSLAGDMEEGFLLLHRHDAYEIAVENPAFRAELEAICSSFVDVFYRAILAGQEDGSMDPEISPRKVAMILFALLDSIVRLNTYRLYDAGSLYHELLKSCRKMLCGDTLSVGGPYA